MSTEAEKKAIAERQLKHLSKKGREHLDVLKRTRVINKCWPVSK